MSILFRFIRFVRSKCAPIAAVIGFSCLLTFIFILYQPTPGPGIKQRLGWQSWDSITMSSEVATTSSQTNTTSNQTGSSGSQIGIPEGVDWWNVTGTGETTVDSTSFPLDVWAPLLPHDTGLSEIAVTHCYVNPYVAGDLCSPPTTPEKDAIRGPWVRVERNINYESGYWSGYVTIFYRRTRRLDINLIDSIRLLPVEDVPTPLDGWSKAETSLRSGVLGAAPLFLWYHVGKTASDMTGEEKNQIITEIDVLYGGDVPWFGFEKLEPPTHAISKDYAGTFITARKGVKPIPKAPPLHFSRDGRFKILQIADLHYSVSIGSCRDMPPDTDLDKLCTSPDGPGSDNLTSTLLARMLDVEKPDLVVFTGDQLNGQGSSWDPKSVLAKFSKEVWGRGIPWAAVFGNHDAESALLDREGQIKLMENMPYSLTQRGPKDIHGVGNYLLKVRSADPSATHLLSLYFLDSGSYSRGFTFWGSFFGTEYDWLRQSQIDWFLQESASIDMIERPFTPDGAKDLGPIWARQTDQLTPQTRRLAKPNAMMFFHMPLQEAYSPADKNPNTKQSLDVGTSGQEDNGDAPGNDGFFTKAILNATESNHVNAQTKQEVKVVANGHCHLTDNCRRIQGVWMCFGGGGSYSGYGKVGFDRRFRVYEISDYGEKIRTWKRLDGAEAEPEGTVVDDLVLYPQSF